MHTLLIYIGLVEGFDSYDKGGNWFNHGIGILSTILKREGHEVTYLDCRKMKGWNDIEQLIHRTNFELAMITISSVDFEPSKRIARMIKEKSSRLKIMVGGPHPTLMTDETIQETSFDYIVTHEAEITLPKLLCNFPAIPRLTRGEMPLDLDILPFVDRSLAPEGESSMFAGLPGPYFAIMASRGCLYRCSFCQPAERALFGNKVRRRSIDNIMTELEMLTRDYGMHSFMIHDDCFTQYSSWVEEFCIQKAKRGLLQPFACQSRADIICKKPELIRKLAEAGLRRLFIGFESGSDRVLQFLKKGTTVAQNIEAAHICRQHGINIFANYMFGIPTETQTEMLETVKMIRTINPDKYSPAIFTPTPGSELYCYCQDHDLSAIQSTDGYSRDAFSAPKIKGMDYDFIRQMVFRSVLGQTLGQMVHLFFKWLPPGMGQRIIFNLRGFKRLIVDTISAKHWLH